MDGEDFCPQGCYWDCEHRLERLDAAERRRLRPVSDDEGRPLHRCRECGDFFTDAVRHGREHQRMRQLGLLPERRRAGWHR